MHHMSLSRLCWWTISSIAWLCADKLCNLIILTKYFLYVCWWTSGVFSRTLTYITLRNIDWWVIYHILISLHNRNSCINCAIASICTFWRRYLGSGTTIKTLWTTLAFRSTNLSNWLSSCISNRWVTAIARITRVARIATVSCENSNSWIVWKEIS